VVSGDGVRPRGVLASLPTSFLIDTREAGLADLDVVIQVCHLRCCSHNVSTLPGLPLLLLMLMPVSHRAYGLYGQAGTVNAYGHPKTRRPAAVSSLLASQRC